MYFSLSPFPSLTSSNLLSEYCSHPNLPSAVLPLCDTSVTPKKSPRALPIIPAPLRSVTPDPQDTTMPAQQHLQNITSSYKCVLTYTPLLRGRGSWDVGNRINGARSEVDSRGARCDLAFCWYIGRWGRSGTSTKLKVDVNQHLQQVREY